MLGPAAHRTKGDATSVAGDNSFVVWMLPEAWSPRGQLTDIELRDESQRFRL